MRNPLTEIKNDVYRVASQTCTLSPLGPPFYAMAGERKKASSSLARQTESTEDEQH